MDKTYDPDAIETRWYKTWEENGYFSPIGDGPGYCIMLPPPNVTGSLHMGHAFQQTLMDILVRYHRMAGDRTLWQCGTDHAGIATQMVVERQLEQQGLIRHDLGRQAFVEKIWEWKRSSGDTITRQSRRLGTSMDWSRERFTMDEGLSNAVREVFVRLYEEGLIYRGQRLVNWDPELHTAISDLEVIAEEEEGWLWYIKYPLVEGPDHVTVATTRPETMFGDTAVAVNPEDQRYAGLIGREVELPLSGRRIPIIADDYVDPEFGTGCLKITPAHDFNDYEVGQRHGLPVINVLSVDAAINDNGPPEFRGLDRFAARSRAVEHLQAAGLLAKTTAHRLMVPRGDRSGAVIEPYLTDQWFVRVEPLAGAAIEAVECGRIRFVPENWSKTYFEWMRNIEDWCISRQLWWGHQIPAWYDTAGEIYVGRSESEARERHKLGADVILTRDPDVLDTWFSSALWPFSTLGWPQQTPELSRHYPTSVLVTGFDIIFFWVARMIMMGLKFMGDVPFYEVYIHGLVRDADGRKMSKSKGNILDPLDLIDGVSLPELIRKRTTGLLRPDASSYIEQATRRNYPNGIQAYGTDALRFTFASLASPGRDINFDVGRIGGYRNFCNKIWNAARFVLMNLHGQNLTDNSAGSLGTAERWIQSRLSTAIAAATTGIETYRFDLSAQAIYEFTWDEYCDWYLELAKITLNDDGVDADRKRGTRQTLLNVLERLLRLAHPIMPFITEEVWQRLAPLCGCHGDTIMLQPFPDAGEFPVDASAVAEIAWAQSFVLGLRRIRGEMNISPAKKLTVFVFAGTDQEVRWLKSNKTYLCGLARLEQIEDTGEPIARAATAIAGGMSLFVPLADVIDPGAELKRLQRELTNRRAELQRCEKKLENSGFLEKAPQHVVQMEQNKQVELLEQVKKLERQITSLRDLVN